MSGAQHTPGPWFIVRYGDGDSLVICTDEAGEKRVAFMATPGSRFLDERRKAWAKIRADARLIRAAPELLEALRFVTPLVRSAVLLAGGYQLTEQGRARLAQAEALLARIDGAKE